MTWLTLRLQRTELILLLVAVVAVGAAFIATFDEARLQWRPISNAACPVPLTQAGPTSYCFVEPGFLYLWVNEGVPYLIVLPLLLALLLTIPVIMELHDRTYRLAWTQSATRGAWAKTRLGLIFIIGVAVIGLSIVAVRWWLPGTSYWNTARQFDVSGIVGFGWLVFAVGLTLSIGTALRRPLIALAVSAVGFVLLRVAFRQEIRPYLIAPRSKNVDPLTGYLPSLGEDVWVVDQWSTRSDGSRITDQQVSDLCSATGLVNSWEQTEAQANAYVACIQANGIGRHIEYQPESRYWPLQYVEAGLLAAIGVILIGWTVWYWLRRLE